MSIVTTVIGHARDLDPRYGIDPLLLTSEERAGAHFVAETASGRAIRVSLPRGRELGHGDVLMVEGDWAVVVRAAEEDLLLVQPRGEGIEWWAACYQLGNLHRPARFLHDGILTLADPMALTILSELDVTVTPVRRPFVGRRFGAAGAHGHAHPLHHAEEAGLVGERVLHEHHPHPHPHGEGRV